ncbi:SCP2 sterol-binding domain-containing protein [Effusibacillus consociatus]|uniref:SCP2 sterol-binding domain-containing protein n=1 Tax=Effusibacillus consociatus TaxID=1117041 RepID=A0ABV9PYU4_9BACL
MIKNSNANEIFQEIEKVMNENPKPFEGMNAIYQYDLSGDDGGTYQLHLSEGKAKVEKGAPSESDCTLQMSVDNFKAFFLGNLNGTVAFMTGKLKIKGNIGMAMKLENLLRQYDLSQYR